MVHGPYDTPASSLGFGVFPDRNEAGRRLAERLLHLKDKRPVVLALPRGGVPVGYEVAKALGAPLDLVFVRKIGAPFQPELALGAVADGGHPITVLNEQLVGRLEISETFLEEETKRKLAEIDRRREVYKAGRPRLNVKGCTAIVVDDGIATGATVRAALQSVRKGAPDRLVLAVPVAPPETIEALESEADEVICLEAPVLFFAIGQFYRNFEQLSDQEVVEWLKRAAEVIDAEPAEPESAEESPARETGSDAQAQ